MLLLAVCLVKAGCLQLLGCVTRAVLQISVIFFKYDFLIFHYLKISDKYLYALFPFYWLEGGGGARKGYGNTDNLFFSNTENIFISRSKDLRGFPYLASTDV